MADGLYTAMVIYKGGKGEVNVMLLNIEDCFSVLY